MVVVTANGGNVGDRGGDVGVISSGGGNNINGVSGDNGGSSGDGGCNDIGGSCGVCDKLCMYVIEMLCALSINYELYNHTTISPFKGDEYCDEIHCGNPTS